MPTLAEACAALEVNRVTLRKWMERLKIQPAREEYDQRFWHITDKQLEAIKDARSKMSKPQSTGHIKKHYNVALRAKSDGAASPIATLQEVPRAPLPAPRRARTLASSSEGLPEGMVSRSELAERHGIALTTMRRWCDAGKIATDGGVYASEAGRFSIAHPVTRHGQRAFYQLASGRAGFRRCDRCPHDTEADASGSVAAEAE